MAGEMIVDQIKVIDADTHITEPYDLFTSRVSTKKWGDKVPHVRTMPWETAKQWDPSADPNADRDIWVLNGQPSSPIGITTMAGWRNWPPAHPSTLDEFDPAAYDSTKRLERMDQYGIYAHVLYPNVAGFGNQNFLKLEDPELMIACVRAYNDFQTEWSSVDAKRLLPIAAMPFWDLEETVKEIDRCFKLGHKGVLFPQSPHLYGDQPMLADPHWEPVWNLAEELGLAINFHIGSGDPINVTEGYEGNGQQANYAKGTVRLFMANMNGVMEILISGICHRHPKLNFVSVESGIGWVPYVIEALDWQWLNAGARDEHPEMDLLPSEYFKRQVYACFWFEKESARHTMQMLPDNLLYETDFPHPTSMSPGPASVAAIPKNFIEEVFSQVPEETRRKVLHDNAALIYHLDD